MMTQNISQALTETEPRALAAAIKVAVSRQLEAVDEQVRVSHTDYFNHSFVPDLVLRWPTHNEGTREVYIRRFGDGPTIAEDIETLGDSGPMIVGLETEGSGTSGQARSAIPIALAKNQETLLTEGTALETFEREPRRETLLETVGSALLRGGRGEFYAEQAQFLRKATSRALGVDGPPSLDAAQVSLTLELLEDSLQPLFASDVSRFIRLVWLAHGGSIENFPGRTEEGAIEPEEMVRLLRHLFAMDEVQDEHFWRRLGQNLSMDIFRLMKAQDPHPNLHKLIQHNPDRLVTSFSAVHRWMGDEFGSPIAWRVCDGFLQLATPTLEIRFATSGDRFARTRTEEGPPLEVFASRAAGRRIISVETESATIKVNVQAKGEESASGTFERLSTALGTSSRVREARLEIAGTEATCDFTRRRLRVADSITVHRLAREVGALLLGLEGEGQETLSDFLDSGLYTPADELAAAPEADEDPERTLRLFDESDGGPDDVPF